MDEFAAAVERLSKAIAENHRLQLEWFIGRLNAVAASLERQNRVPMSPPSEKAV